MTAVIKCTYSRHVNFHWIDYITQPDFLRLDDAQTVRKLIEIAHGVAAQVDHAEIVKNNFLNGQPAEPFRPV